MLWLLASIHFLTGVHAIINCQYYQWTNNEDNQSPCDVGWSLINECQPGLGPLYPLRNDIPSYYYYYFSDLNATGCMCNTITYSLMSACGLCQGQSYTYWSNWVYQCNNRAYLYEYPQMIPPNVHVPKWAWMDVTTQDYFNITAAYYNATGSKTLLASSVSGLPSQIPQGPTNMPPSNGTTSGCNFNCYNTATTVNNGETNKRGVDIPTLIGAITGAVSGLVVLTLAVLRYRAYRSKQAREAKDKDTERRKLVKEEEDWPETEYDFEMDTHGESKVTLHG